MRRSLLIAIAILAACSGTTEPTSTTTTLPTATSTASPQALIPGALIPADPATLVPLENAEPVVVGRAHQGTVSPNGRWAAIRTEQTEDRGYRISIIDVNSLLVVADEDGSGDGLRVDDEGRAAWLEEGELRLLEVTSEQPTLEAPPTSSYLTNTLSIFPDGRIGYLSGPEDDLGTVSVVVVEGEEATVHGIDQVTSGPVDSDDPSLPQRSLLIPDVAWDTDNNRAIVISADRDVMVEVDLGTGDTTEHEFATGESPDEQNARRDAYMNADGSILFIATSLLEVAIESDTWEAVQSAQQLVAVDTSDWSSRLVAAQGDTIYPSPVGQVIATTGSEVTTDSEGTEDTAQSPVFLVDASSGEPLVGFEGRSGTIVDVQFSADGAEMYVLSEGIEGTNIDIVDVASRQLAGSLGFERISLVGGAGMVAFHPR